VDRSAVKVLYEAHILALMKAVGIPHWEIGIRMDLDDRDADAGFSSQGKCTYNVDYNRATINVQPDELANADQALEVLRHELYHCVLSPFELVKQVAVELLDDDHQAIAALSRVYQHACEQGVVNLGRMWIGVREYVQPPTAKGVIMAGEKDRSAGGRNGLDEDVNEVERVRAMAAAAGRPDEMERIAPRRETPSGGMPPGDRGGKE
jgi:hypothetical protein